MLFLALSFGMMTLLLIFQSSFVKREKKLKVVSWNELVLQLEPMDIAGMREIADCYLQPTQKQLRIEPGAMWETVGGVRGLGMMTNNVRVMLDLAMFAERWNDANGRVLSEIMRRDATRINAALCKIEAALLTQRGLVYLGLDLQEAISSYCLMRARLIGMYTECHIGLLPRLEAVL